MRFSSWNNIQNKTCLVHTKKLIHRKVRQQTN